MENYKVKVFRSICEELENLYSKKNEEYGDSFGEVFKEDGIKVCLIQIKHKLNRAINICDKENVEFESLEDTLKDIANYALMTYMEYRLNYQSEVVQKKAMTKKEKAIYDYKSVINKKIREFNYFDATEKLEVITNISEIKTIGECVYNLVDVLRLIVRKSLEYNTNKYTEENVSLIEGALDIFKLQFELMLKFEDEDCDELINALIEATKEVNEMNFNNVIDEVTDIL